MQIRENKQTVKAHGLEFVPFISEEAIRDRVQEIGQQLSEAYKGKNPLFIGVLNGSFMFLADLVRASELDCDIAFTRLSSYEGMQSTGKIKTVIELEEKLEGRHLIVVEDIVDTGKTMHYFLQKMKSKNPASVALVSLLVKPEAVKHEVIIDYTGFEIENKFVIGYGLDYDGLCRNLPAIYQLKS